MISAPAGAGDVVAVFATGLGATQPPVQSGQAAPSDALGRVTVQVEATVDGKPAVVQFAGLAPGPAVPLVLLQNRVPSNKVTPGIR